MTNKEKRRERRHLSAERRRARKNVIRQPYEPVKLGVVRVNEVSDREKSLIVKTYLSKHPYESMTNAEKGNFINLLVDLGIEKKESKDDWYSEIELIEKDLNETGEISEERFENARENYENWDNSQDPNNMGILQGFLNQGKANPTAFIGGR